MVSLGNRALSASLAVGIFKFPLTLCFPLLNKYSVNQKSITMGKRRKSSPFSNLQYALLGNSVNVYGAVEDIIAPDPGGQLIIHLKDESGKLELVVPPEAAGLFKTLEIGDILRCYNLEKFGSKIRFGGNKEYQCVAWPPAEENSDDFTVKFATSVNDVFYDQIRISELRALKVGNQPSTLEVEIEDHKKAVVLAQICREPLPALPEKLQQYYCIFNKIRADFARTLPSFSQIPNHTNFFKTDNFFNIFAQVLAIHSAPTFYVFQVWDGSYHPEFKMLSPLNSLGVTGHIPLDLPLSLHERVLNILVYKASNWEKTVQKIKKNDIILFTNMHVDRRPLGDLALTMHEGHADKRFLLTVPSDHKAAIRVKEQCAKVLPQIPDISVSQEAQSEDLDVANIFSTQNSIPQWNPSTQALLDATLEPIQEEATISNEAEPMEVEEEEITVLKTVEIPEELRPKRRSRLSYEEIAKRTKIEPVHENEAENNSIAPENSENNIEKHKLISNIEEQQEEQPGPSGINNTTENDDNNMETAENTAVEPVETIEKEEQRPITVKLRFIETSPELISYLKNAKMPDYSSYSLKIEEKLMKLKAEARREYEGHKSVRSVGN